MSRNITTAATQLVLAITLLSHLACNSPNQTVKELNNREKLVELLSYPKLYVGKKTELEGLVQSVETKKVTKDITMLTLQLAPQTDSRQPVTKRPAGDKYAFLSQVVAIEAIYSTLKSSQIELTGKESRKFQHIAYTCKVAAKKLEAMNYFLKSSGKTDTAKAIQILASAYSRLGEAYLFFEEATILKNLIYQSATLKPVAPAKTKIALPEKPLDKQDSLPEKPLDKKREKEHDNSQPETKEIAPPNSFEKALFTTGKIYLAISDQLIASQKTIEQGLHPFEYQKVFGQETSYTILQHASVTTARSLEKVRDYEIQDGEYYKLLADALNEVGQACGELSRGLEQLGSSLNKTAIRISRAQSQVIKCAYFGYNGSHLARCAHILKSLNGNRTHTPVTITGTLVKSDLREEVDVLWFQAKKFRVDGLEMLFNYGDESGAVKGTVELYEWVEDVDKGDK